MDLLSWLSDKFRDIADSIFEILPKSPIKYLATTPEIQKVIGYINWFCPIYLWISILEAWLVCVITYYALQIILRWIKVVE